MDSKGNNEKSEKKILGKCPVCGCGNILKYHGSYICTEHFTNADGHKRCSFILKPIVKNCKITDDTVMQLIDNGETEYMEMKANATYPYMGKIVVIPGKGLEVRALKKELGISCPKCGGKILITRQGYACENEMKKDATCNFFVGNRLSNRIIREEEVRDYIEGKEKILDGFTSKAKVMFSGYLKMNEKGGADISVEVGKCPNCGGEIRVGYRAFNCSNYKNGCNFNIFREFSGHPMTVKEARELLSKGEVKIDCSDTYANKFIYRLYIAQSEGKACVKKEKIVNKSILNNENNERKQD